jgi:hypothetical protein
MYVLSSIIRSAKRSTCGQFYVTASEAQLAQFVEGVMDEAAANAVINDQGGLGKSHLRNY